jgi:hypothetical protein
MRGASRQRKYQNRVKARARFCDHAHVGMLPQLASAGWAAAVDSTRTAAAAASARRADSAALGSAARTDTACALVAQPRAGRARAVSTAAHEPHRASHAGAARLRTLRPDGAEARTRSGATAEVVKSAAIFCGRVGLNVSGRACGKCAEDGDLLRGDACVPARTAQLVACLRTSTRTAAVSESASVLHVIAPRRLRLRCLRLRTLAAAAPRPPRRPPRSTRRACSAPASTHQRQHQHRVLMRAGVT